MHSYFYYFTFDPFGNSSMIVGNVNVPSFEAANTIPSDNSPRSFTGFKFVTTKTLRPTNCSGW